MFGLGMPELMVVGVIVTVLFGGSKLPELGKGLGHAIGNFRKAINTKQLEDAAKDLVEPEDAKKTV